MSPSLEPLSAGPFRRFFRPVALAAATLVIALLFFRVPDSPGSEGHSSYRMLLDLSFRPGAAESLPIATLDGPLVPLQQPVYVGRSIWRSIVWQIGSNLTMAAIVAGSLFRLPASRAWWALTIFVVLGIFDASVAPWITLFMLGAVAKKSEKPVLAILASVGMGILGATSIAHFLLATGAIAWPAAAKEPDRKNSPLLCASGFLAGFVGTWVVLDQSPLKLVHWLTFGLLDCWTPSSLFVSSATTLVYPVAGLVTIAWIGSVFLGRKTLRLTAGESRDVLLVTWGLFLAWKFRAIQPGGSPLLFFATAMLGGFLLLPRSPLSATAILLLGLFGATLPDRLLVSDAVGRINRQILQNVREISLLPGVRDRLRQNFTGYGTSFAMPLTRSAIGDNPIGLLSDQSTHAVLNGFRVIPSRLLLTGLAPEDQVSARKGQAFPASDAPSFVLERIDRDTDLFPPLRDGHAQLALYSAFDFVLSEQGFSLWRKRNNPLRGTLKLIATGEVRYGENFKLPATGGGLWIELDCAPNLLGKVLDQARPLTEPRIRTVDVNGDELGYAIAWRTARSGFLADPFFRGDVDVLKFQEGQTPVRVTSVVVDAPPSTPWAWRPRIRYRIYELPSFDSARLQNLTALQKQTFAALNRMPISFTTPFTPISGVLGEKSVIFMHPDSVMEIPVTQSDRTIVGSFGIVPAAYTNPGPSVTDGVSFSIEFVPAAGSPKRLLQRSLDPAVNSRDREPQKFTIALPPSSGGRLLLRTFNLPQATSSFDWSYWRQIELK